MKKIKLVKAIISSNLSEENKAKIIESLYNKEYVYAPHYPYLDPLYPVTYDYDLTIVTDTDNN